MSELAGLIAEVNAEELSDQAGIEALLLPYRDNQDAQNLYGKEAGRLGAQLKEWLALHPGEQLVDGEHGLVGFLQTRRVPGHRFDLVSIIENNPALFARLVSVRALQVDYEVAKAAGLDSELKRYSIPMGETSALIVKRKE